jgi:hypothetical protein
VGELYGLQSESEALKNDYRPYESYYRIHFRAMGLRQLKDGRWTYTKTNIWGRKDKRYTYIILDEEKEEIESKYIGVQVLCAFTTGFLVKGISRVYFNKNESILYDVSPYSYTDVIVLSVFALAFVASIRWGSKKISKLNQKLLDKYGEKNATR